MAELVHGGDRHVVVAFWGGGPEVAQAESEAVALHADLHVVLHPLEQ
jgi:hypothetical protein